MVKNLTFSFFASVFCVILSFAICFPFSSYAEFDNKAVITIEVNPIIYKKELSLEADIALYNVECSDNLFLSYHIIDPVTEQSIQFENQRYPIFLDESNKSKIDLYIDVNNYMNTYKSIDVVFDIIDVTNSYWFSTSPIITLESNSIKFQNDPISNIRYNIREHLKIFICNIIFCVIVICFYFKMRHYFEF